MNTGLEPEMPTNGGLDGWRVTCVKHVESKSVGIHNPCSLLGALFGTIRSDTK